MQIRREMIAEPAAHVNNTGKAMVVEIGDDGAGEVPFFPTWPFAEPGLAGIDESVVLAAMNW